MVFDEYRTVHLCSQFRSLHTPDPRPESSSHPFMRLKDIMFVSRSTTHITRQAEIHQMRRICATPMHLVEINAQHLEGETNARNCDFSHAAVEARWQAGYAVMCRMLERRSWENPIDPSTEVTDSPDHCHWLPQGAWSRRLYEFRIVTVKTKNLLGSGTRHTHA
jgi:hypothetical protein